MTLNLGMRYEIQRLSSANDVAVSGESDAEACTAHGECRIVNGLTLANNWSPRLGLSWDPLSNGRTKIYGFWGRFYEAIPLDMNIRAINGERYIILQHVSNTPLNSTNWFNNNGSPLARNGPWTVRSTTAADFRDPVALIDVNQERNDRTQKQYCRDHESFAEPRDFQSKWRRKRLTSRTIRKKDRHDRRSQ